MFEDEISRLIATRDRLKVDVESMLEAGRRAGREQLAPAEQTALRDVRTLTARIEALSAERARAGSVTELSARIQPDLPPPTPARTTAMRRKDIDDYSLTYRRGDPQTSWIRDLMRTSLPGMDDTGESRARLMRHAEEVATNALFADYRSEYRDLNRTDGTGGYAVPPAWLMNQYIELARPGRPFANVVQRQPLPGGTDSINIPKILTGTTVAMQTSDNSSISNTDITDTFVNAPVRTIAGQEGVAIQLIDQSPIAFDDVIFRDLVAAHAAVVDQQVLDGTGTSGQVTGIDYTPGVLTVTPSALTIQGIYSAIANAIQQIHTQRFLPPEVIVMHPRRWGWLLSLLDTTDRPLFLPNANGPWNVAGLETAVESQQVVGSVQGLPVITDPNVSTTNGPWTPSGNEDILYICRASDLVLWESGLRGRVLPETKASTLTVLIQLYGYVAFTAARYPASTAVISGLTAPTF